MSKARISMLSGASSCAARSRARLNEPARRLPAMPRTWSVALSSATLASTVEFTKLLAAQRRHGIETCRAPRGQVARQQRSHDDESRGHRQDQETAEPGVWMS